jgi:hypothetical protein
MNLIERHSWKLVVATTYGVLYGLFEAVSNL